MRLTPWVLYAAATGALIQPVSAADEFVSLFDGRSLDGWRATDPSYWSVEDGAITGRITPAHPCAENQYLVWEGGELADFELTLESRLNGDGMINNGFQFRSRQLPDGDVCGYQVDNNLGTPWLVRLYDEYGRHDLALRGERAAFDAAGRRTVAPLEECAGEAWFALEDWHEYRLVCIGGRIALYVNGRLATEVEDSDPRRAEPQGILALQLHSGPPTEVQFRNIRLKVLKPADDTALSSGADSERRTALLSGAMAWWQLDSAGRGAARPLTSVPQFYQLELNVLSSGPGAVPGAKCVVLDGAYFDAGPGMVTKGDALTVFLRLRDPAGAWDAALMGQGVGGADLPFRLFARDVDGDGASDIAFEVRTDRGVARAHFPATRDDARAWRDLVGRYDGRELALFCDGALVAALPHAGAVIPTEAPLIIAAEKDGDTVSRHFRGELEDAAVWSRALTNEEVAALSETGAR